MSDYDAETTQNGGRKAVSPEGATTGHGNHLMICDDLCKAGDVRSPAHRDKVQELFERVLFPRLDDKRRSSIIILQQRLHEDDIVRRLLDKGGWHHLCFPAIATQHMSHPTYFGQTYRRAPGDILSPNYESAAVLEEARRDMGEAGFQEQCQQNPVPTAGNRIREEWFSSYDIAGGRDDYLCVVQSIDTAFSAQPQSDWSVCLTAGMCEDESWDLLEIDRVRLDFPDLITRTMHNFKKWNPDQVIIEDKATGRPLAQEMRHRLPAGQMGRVITHSPTVDKLTRVEVQSAKLRDGLIYLPQDGRNAPWLHDFINELKAFPAGKYDDQVDALVQFLEWLDNRRGRTKVNRALGRPTRPEGGTRAQGTDFARYFGKAR
jgi:predicted phage terminase large subunit-like protein